MRHALIAALAAAALAGAADAATLLDGSFETVVQSGGGYTYNPAGSAWTFEGASGLTRNNTAWGFADAPAGTQVAFLQNTSRISQTITGLTAAKRYIVTFAIADRPGYEDQKVTLSFDGSALYSETPASTAWGTRTVAIQASGTTGVLAFSTVQTGFDNDAGIDAVSIAAVPEPATWGLMALGFGLTGVAMRGCRRTLVAA